MFLGRFMLWLLVAIVGSVTTTAMFGIQSGTHAFLIGMAWGFAAGIAHIVTTDL